MTEKTENKTLVLFDKVAKLEKDLGTINESLQSLANALNTVVSFCDAIKAITPKEELDRGVAIATEESVKAVQKQEAELFVKNKESIDKLLAEGKLKSVEILDVDCLVHIKTDKGEVILPEKGVRPDLKKLMIGEKRGKFELEGVGVFELVDIFK
jgi:hypothetical protein